MHLLKRRWFPCALLLLGVGILLLMADCRTYRREGVTITVVADSVTSRSVTVEILNTTDRRVSNAGEWEPRYRLQRRLCGLWLPMREAEPEGCMTLPSCFYEKDIPERLTFYWCNTRPFDALYPGQYRLVLGFYEDGGGDTFALAAEFRVN